MKKIYYFIIMSFTIFVSCDKEDDPGNENGKYDPNKQVLYNGVIWDKKVTKEYCTYEEALEFASKAGKRIPTYEEAVSIFKNINFDKNIDGFWIGSDSEMKSESINSLLLYPKGFIYESEVSTYPEICFLWVDHQLNNNFCFCIYNDQYGNVKTEGMPASSTTKLSLMLVKDE